MSQLVHMFLTIDSNREDVQKISNALAINQKELTEILNSLSTMGFISFVDRKIRVLKDHVHLSQQSKIYNAHRKLMRMKSLERLDQSQSPDPCRRSGTQHRCPYQAASSCVRFLSRKIGAKI